MGMLFIQGDITGDKPCMMYDAFRLPLVVVKASCWTEYMLISDFDCFDPIYTTDRSVIDHKWYFKVGHIYAIIT